MNINCYPFVRFDPISDQDQVFIHFSAVDDESTVDEVDILLYPDWDEDVADVGFTTGIRDFLVKHGSSKDDEDISFLISSIRSSFPPRKRR